MTVSKRFGIALLAGTLDFLGWHLESGFPYPVSAALSLLRRQLLGAANPGECCWCRSAHVTAMCCWSVLLLNSRIRGQRSE